MTELIVKRITATSYHLVVDLFNNYRIFYKQPSDIASAENYIRQRLHRKESIIYTVLVDGKPIGFTQLYPTYSSVRLVKNWILNDLYVDPDYRKQGVAAKLINTVIEFAKGDGSKFVQLETANDNFNAQRLYESLGFVKQEVGGEFYLYKLNVS